jgi:GTPase SAR1 family protein
LVIKNIRNLNFIKNKKYTRHNNSRKMEGKKRVPDYSIKNLILGDTAVGKTCILL